MPLLKLKLPPGVSANGTLYQNQGRWYAADLVRWAEDAMQPIGGWQRLTDGADAAIDVGGPVRGLYGWRNNSGAAYLAIATHRELHIYSGGAINDRTPSGFVAGGADAVLSSGSYGEGAYGAGSYGAGSEAAATLTEANSWAIDNYGEDLVLVAYSDGKVYYFDTSAGTAAAQLTNSPTDCLGVVVTPERYILALGAGGDPRRVEWADQDDNTIWTPVVGTNTAGGENLPGSGQLMTGVRLRNETLLLTSNDAFAARFLGGDLIYTFPQVGANCGIISRRAVAVVEGRAFWMGNRGFFTYDGFAKEIPCSLSDDIFTNLTTVQRSKVCAIPNSDFGEVWFCYPANGSTENNRVAVLNYREGFWYGPFTIARTAGIPRAPFSSPYMGGAEGSVFIHESGTSRDEPDAFAAGEINFTSNINDGDTVTVGDITYTFKNTLTGAANEVLRSGVSQTNTRENLANAINDNQSSAAPGDGDAGTGWTSATEQNPLVSASDPVGPVVSLAARHRGTNGNSIALSASIAAGAPDITAFAGGTDTAKTPSAESGPFEIGNGDRTMMITRLIPDEDSLGDVDVTIYVADYPTATERTQAITTLNEPTDVRLSGRQGRVKVQGDSFDWRWGVPRLEVRPRGRR